MSKRLQKDNLEAFTLEHFGVDINKQKGLENLIEEVVEIMVGKGYEEEQSKKLLAKAIDDPKYPLPLITDNGAESTEEPTGDEEGVEGDVESPTESTESTEGDITDEEHTDESEDTATIDNVEGEESTSESTENVGTVDTEEDVLVGGSTEDAPVKSATPVEESDSYKKAMGLAINGKKVRREGWKDGVVVYGTELPTGKKQLTIMTEPAKLLSSEYVPSRSEREAKDWDVA